MTNRRKFLSLAGFTGAAILVNEQSTTPSAPNTAPPKSPPLDAQLVKEFVIAGHVDLEKVKTMLAAQPALLNAAWDWGGGDYEMAIGGAGHMGRADIANYLISQGGRFDIFVAAMLGRLDMVKNALTAYPNLAQSKGPHGIPLIVHAQKGGDAAAEVLKYLKSLT
jgi:hypothetical protein